MPFYKWSELEGQPRPGNRVLRMIGGEKFSLLRVEHLGPAEHTTHVHDDCEQISNLLEGEMEFTVGGETRLVRPGEVVVAPAGVPHATRVPAGVRAVALEFFTPPRKDLKP